MDIKGKLYQIIFYRIIAIFMVGMDFVVAGSQSNPHLSRATGCLATQGGTLVERI